MRNDRYRNYMLVLLMLILSFNYVDRAILAIVLQDIKADLALSDSQLGFLTGLAFALFYAVMGIPLARWADHGNRKVIIALTTAVQCSMVVACGLAGSFLQLLAARVGVAVGEAGCMPPANSLIPEYFSRDERPRAMSIYLLGIPLSLTLGYFVGGLLNELIGWRMTFIVMGVPGFVLGLIGWLTLKEPRASERKPLRTNDSGNKPQVHVSSFTATAPTLKDENNTAIPLKDVIFYLWRCRTFRHLSIAFSVMGFFGSGISTWLPSFFIRSHGMDTAELGFWMAMSWGVAGGLGTYLGGWLSSRFAAGREALQFKGIAALFIAFWLVSLVTYSTPDKYLALSLMALSAFSISALLAPLLAAIQGLVPHTMRAQATAVVFLFNSLIGLGLGPLAAGLLSDVINPSFGEESLRYTLLLLSPGYLWTAFHYWRVTKTIESDMAKVESVEKDRAAIGVNRVTTHRSIVSARQMP